MSLPCGIEPDLHSVHTSCSHFRVTGIRIFEASRLIRRNVEVDWDPGESECSYHDCFDDDVVYLDPKPERELLSFRLLRGDLQGCSTLASCTLVVGFSIFHRFYRIYEPKIITIT